MTVALFTHNSMLQHQCGDGHPERPERLGAILNNLRQPEFQALQWREAPQASVEDIALVHTRAHIDAMLEPVAEGQLRAVDADTALCSASAEAALRAVDAVVTAVQDVAEGRIDQAFCAVRPPGHHAEADRACGFCLFNNVAIGARVAQQRCGFQRVAVYDFDVHHGNGTQNSFWNDADAFYVSTHQSPCFPGTGQASERGTAANILNVPLAAGTDGFLFRDAVTHQVLPALAAFRPDFLFVSAGFDAHRSDPLTQLLLETEDYFWLGQVLGDFARQHCQGRLVSVLEGGYELEALAESVGAYIKGTMGR